ncbi:MAG: TGS domain-containing protein [Thermoproteota archaeon]
MVTNLPPQAEAQYKKVIASKSREEKLKNLKIFLSMIPEHKGTEKFRAQVKRQISRLQEEILLEKKKRSSRPIIFEKGETTILTVIISTDRALLYELLAGMKCFAEQLILESLSEIKPLTVGFKDVSLSFISLSTSMMNTYGYSLIQTILSKSDLILILLDKSPMDDLHLIRDMLTRFGIYLASKNSLADFKALGAGGITIMNKSRFLKEEEAKRFLTERELKSGILHISEYTSIYTLEGSLRGLQRKNFMVLAKEEEGLADMLEVPEDLVLKIDRFLINPLETVFKYSGLIRVYLKPPSAQTPSEKPMIVEEDITVEKLASRIHRDLSEKLKYARLWRGGLSSTPLRIGGSFKLSDKDVIELRTK